MIVRQFLQWVRTAGAAERAEATTALARAYLYSDLSPDDRAATEGALIMLLDDPSPLVREALARALAFSEQSPPPVILGLAADQPEVASWVLEHSPLLIDADLVDAVATGRPQTQAAIARRADLPCAVSAAIAEVGSAEACLVLIENDGAEIVAFSLDRIVERHGHLAAIREAMLARDDLPAPTRQALVAKLSETLAGFVTARAWLDEDRAQRIAKEACEKATVTLAAVSPATEIAPLIRHLRESGQLTAGLVLRALLSGNIELFEQALAELSDMPLARVSALVHDRRGTGFRALYDKAGLAGLDLSGVPRGGRGHARGRLRRRAGRRDAAQAPHGRARADALRRRVARRYRAAAAAAAPLRGRSGARRGAHVLQRAGGGGRDRSAVSMPSTTSTTSASRRSARSHSAAVIERCDRLEGWLRMAMARDARCARSYHAVENQTSAPAAAPGCRPARPAGRLFSCARNSSVTSRSRLVSASAICAMSGARLLADDGAHRIDMLIDQRDRNAAHVGRVLDQPAQAVGGRRDERIAEGRGLALDVVGGVKQRVAGRLVEALRP